MESLSILVSNTLSRRHRTAGLAVVLMALAVLVAACGNGTETEGDGAAPTPEGTEVEEDAGEPVEEPAEGDADGSEITVWVRQDTLAFYELLADEWNATQDSTIALTPIRQSEFVTRISTAASTGDLPEIVSTDVAFVRPFVEAGIYQDISDRIAQLPYADDILAAYTEAASEGDAVYGVPAAIDVSSVFYNRELFTQAGLDPDDPPSTWDEIRSAAEAIDALGDDIKGYYFAGRCGGCNGFTMLPMVWAQGGEVVAGQDVSVDSPEVRALIEFYADMWQADLMPSGAATDGGEAWISAFTTGNIGIAPYGAFAVGIFQEEGMDVGAFLIPGPDGGESSFAGGDVMGITADANDPEAAWEFIEWSLSDDVQIDVVAANDFLVDRRDLADNEHASQNPLVLLHNEAAEVAQVPDTSAFNELFTDPSGPWNQLIERGVIQGDVDAAIEEAQSAFESIVSSG